MRIFLTFASEQNDIAESIQLALRNRGHQVFFSHDICRPARASMSAFRNQSANASCWSF
jgi:hypothetical protein